MEFVIEKCAMLILKSRRRKMSKGIELSNHEKIRMLGEKETNKYTGILEADTIKHAEMKKKPQKTKKKNKNKNKTKKQTNKYLRRTTKRLETKLYSRNIIKGINTRAVLVKYSGPFLKWTRGELQQIDLRPKNSWRCMKPYIPEMTYTDCMGSILVV